MSKNASICYVWDRVGGILTKSIPFDIGQAFFTLLPQKLGFLVENLTFFIQVIICRVKQELRIEVGNRLEDEGMWGGIVTQNIFKNNKKKFIDEKNLGKK